MIILKTYETKKVIIIGSGIGGLGTAALLSKRGYDVTVLEKNEKIGGRANIFTAKEYTFDMGPSWYLMPDIFEQYFGLFGKKPSDYYKLIRLDPSYCIYFGKEDIMNVPANIQDLEEMFESYEKGSSEKLRYFLTSLCAL